MSRVAPERPPVPAKGIVTLAKRPLARSALPLTELSLGGAQLGNLYRAITDEQARATVDAAWERGIRYLDTAPHYGLGLSERRLGAALAGRPRGEYVLSTKVGRRLEPLSPAGPLDDEGFDVKATHRRVWDFSRDGVLRSLEGSLQRLGVDAVDIVYLHDPDAHRREVLETAYPALEELRGQGVVSAIGAGMNQTAMLADFARHTDMDVLMIAGRYTLLEQSALDDLLPVCERRGIGIVAAGVFNSGLLARSAPADAARYDYVDAPQALVLRARRMAQICERHGTSLPAVALAFPLAHPAVVSVCVGARSPEQIERNISLLRSGVPAAVWGDLREQGLLRPDAPVPADDGTDDSRDQ
jgi:D-threo-aldose 1-dehydrogenase